MSNSYNCRETTFSTWSAHSGALELFKGEITANTYTTGDHWSHLHVSMVTDTTNAMEGLRKAMKAQAAATRAATIEMANAGILRRDLDRMSTSVGERTDCYDRDAPLAKIDPTRRKFKMPKSKLREEPLYPDVVVKLTDENGNIYHLMALVLRALRRDMHLEEELAEFKSEVVASESYEEALCVLMKWVTVE